MCYSCILFWCINSFVVGKVTYKCKNVITYLICVVFLWNFAVLPHPTTSTCTYIHTYININLINVHYKNIYLNLLKSTILLIVRVLCLHTPSFKGRVLFVLRIMDGWLKCILSHDYVYVNPHVHLMCIQIKGWFW